MERHAPTPTLSPASTPSLPLPPAKMRRGGAEQFDDRVFISSAVDLTRVLAKECGAGPHSSVLDIGCGPARLLYGLIAEFGTVDRYVGIEVSMPQVVWLEENVAPYVPYARFIHVPYANERYNAYGKRDLSLTLDERFDCIVLHSVFTHMRLRDIAVYLPFIRKSLADNGFVFLTAFVEDDVPDESENPEGYLMGWKGPLHGMRLNRLVFEKMLGQARLSIHNFAYRGNCNQSYYVLRGMSQKNTSAAPSPY